MLPATIEVILSCSSKLFSSRPSKRSAQRSEPASGHTHLPAGATDRSPYDITSLDAAADPTGIGPAGEGRETRARYEDREPPEAAQLGSDILDKTICEPALLPVTADGIERKYCNRHPLGRPENRYARPPTERDPRLRRLACCRLFADLADEAKSPPAERADHALFDPVVADGSPNRIGARG